MAIDISESRFQASVIRELHGMFPEAIILKNDANYLQGITDLIILYEDRWAALEFKKSKKAKLRPNQAYYVEKLSEMSFASFIYPENKEEVLNELQQTFRSRR